MVVTVNRAQLEVRIKALESVAASTAADFRNFSVTLDKLKLAQRETNNLLRQLMDTRP